MEGSQLQKLTKWGKHKNEGGRERDLELGRDEEERLDRHNTAGAPSTHLGSQ